MPVTYIRLLRLLSLEKSGFEPATSGIVAPEEVESGHVKRRVGIHERHSSICSLRGAEWHGVFRALARDSPY